MKIQLSFDEELMLNLAFQRDLMPSMTAKDCISELWDVVTCRRYHETLSNLTFMNMLDVAWVTDGMGKLRNYRINNAGRHALWLHNRQKEAEYDYSTN